MARKTPKKTEFGGVDINYLGSKSENAEERTVESRRILREMLDTQVKDFINKGGEIVHIDTNVTSEPIKKPQSTYGNRPI